MTPDLENTTPYLGAGRWAIQPLGRPSPLADMKPAVTVLLTSAVQLLTSAAVHDRSYRRLADVSLPGPAFSTSPAESQFTCALRCEALPPEQCSGFTYEDSDGLCRLFSEDCRGPAANDSQQISGRYMSRNVCDGKVTQCLLSALNH